MLFKAIIVAVVEGITEFIPVSSGHMIIVGDMIDFTGEFPNLFAIVIQLGAILAIGFIVAFLSALVCVERFIGYLKKNPMKKFAYYRIILGAALLLRSLEVIAP